MRPALRLAVWRLQLKAVANMAPAMASGIALTGLLLAVFMRSSPLLEATLIWAACTIAVLASFVWWYARLQIRRRCRNASQTPRPNIATEQEKKRIVQNIVLVHIAGFVLGVLWGAFAFVASGTVSAEALTPLMMLIIAVMITGTFWFAVIPTMGIAFLGPVQLGSLIAVASYEGASNTSDLFAALLLICVGTIGVAIRFSRRFVKQIAGTIQTREERTLTQMLLDELQAHSSNWVWQTDQDGRPSRFPEEFELGCGEDDDLVSVLSRYCKIRGAQFDEVKKAFAESRGFRDVELCIEPNGRERWLRISGHPNADEDGNFSGYLGTISDLTSEKLAEDRINTLSHIDTLTGLMNRGAFAERLNQAVANLERYGRPFTVLHLDLDDFKLVNDTRGHLFGDRLLAEAAERIEEEVGDSDLIARLGGDEFAILMDSQGDAGAAARLAAKLIGEVSKPYHFDGEEVRVGLSLGIAIAPLNGTRPEQLLRNADLALYRAKADGRGLFRFFENHMDSELREQRMLESELHDALANEELVLHFQPLVDAKTFKPRGMESLIRWNHPLRGLLPPIEFIGIAEHTDMINKIGRWTLFKACETAINWPEDMFVAVNLSVHHFTRSDIIADVADALKETGLAAKRLELEITESLLIHNPTEVIAKIKELKQLGVTVAMDDFGTGYSSLSYLMSVPFDRLKIDKSFVDKIVDNTSGQAIVKMIASLASELELHVTAEGVEELSQARFLERVGCSLLQGYHFAKPMPPDDVPGYLLQQLNTRVQHAFSGSRKSRVRRAGA